MRSTAELRASLRTWRHLGLALATGALACVVGLAAPSHAQGERDEPRGPGGRISRNIDQLGLDQATKEQIRELLETSADRHRELREERRELRSNLWEMLDQDEPDGEAVMRQAERLGQLETELQKHRLETILRIRGLLNAEQRAALARIQTRERRGRGPRRGPLRRCGADLQQFCSAANAGPALLGCLQQNWAQLSEGCRRGFEGRSPRGRDSR